MAYGGPSQQRDNFNRFQKYATINIVKRLRKTADELQVNLSEAVAKKLKETYKDNVRASYHPRSTGSYEHTGIFLDSIDVEIDHDRGIGRDRVKIVLDENKKYPATNAWGKHPKPHEVTVKQVHEFLTEGTMGGSRKGGSGNYVFETKDGGRYVGYNYPTPAHLFEQHTQIQMKAFLENLDLKNYINNKNI